MDPGRLIAATAEMAELNTRLDRNAQIIGVVGVGNGGSASIQPLGYCPFAAFDGKPLQRILSAA